MANEYNIQDNSAVGLFGKFRVTGLGSFSDVSMGWSAIGEGHGFYAEDIAGFKAISVSLNGTFCARFLAGSLFVPSGSVACATLTGTTKIELGQTVTASGTTGARTINLPSGSVNFAAGATSLVVTNSLVSTSAVIIATVATNDATMKSVAVVAGSGSFTIHANAAATGETRVNWLVVNPAA